ncbi:ankyrin repeat-containing domain protein [Hyaloraphidium curvatum]|nr:ankyrin repeat-containing domain protein [Hyaloraphidium curvatum]
MAGSTIDPSVPGRASPEGEEKEKSAAEPSVKLAPGTVVEKPSLSLKGVVARYDADHDSYIVVGDDLSTFHVRPAKQESYRVQEVDGDEKAVWQKVLKDWEAKGSKYDWATHRWDPAEDHPSLSPTLTPELSRTLLEMALLRQGYGLVSRLLSFYPPSAPYLHFAARSLDPNMVSLVLSKGARVDDTGDEWKGNTALGVLASLCSCEVVGLSKCRGHRRDELWAAGDNELAVEEEYNNGQGGSGSGGPRRGLSGTWNLAIPGETTAQDQLLACAQMLISKSASLDHTNSASEPILFLAMGSHNDALARLLLDKGAWYELPGGAGNPVHAAAGCYKLTEARAAVLGKVEKASDEERARWLWMKDHDGYLPIHYAAQAGDAVLVKRIVGWDSGLVGALSGDGETPLAVAAHYGHPKTIKTLLDLGADPQVRDSRGVGPIEYAGSFAHSRSCEVLGKAIAESVAGGNVPLDVCRNINGGCTSVVNPEQDRTCRRCGTKKYCSVDCAKEDWLGGHRTKCARTQGGRNRSESMVSFVA